jgi:enoyl-[acyl-carrier protein] reductase I
MGILTGKRIVVTGVLTDASLAFGVAKLAQEEGAEVVLTGAGRGLSLTQRTARKLPHAAPVFEFDVTDPSHVDSVREAV